MAFILTRSTMPSGMFQHFLPAVLQDISRRPGKGSSFRLITRELADHIVDHYQSFVFLDELINWYTADIAYVDIQHVERKNKRSGYTPANWFGSFPILFCTTPTFH